MKRSARRSNCSENCADGESLFSAQLAEHALLTRIDVLPKQTLIYAQEGAASSFYYLHSGLVGLYHAAESGKVCLIRIYHQGEFFGFRSLFGNAVHHCSALVLKPASLTRIVPHKPKTFLNHYADLSNFLLSRLASELGDAERRLASMAYDKTAQRVLDSIRFLNEQWPEYIWTWREIAEYAGCETETAIRIGRELKAQGLLPRY